MNKNEEKTNNLDEENPVKAVKIEGNWEEKFKKKRREFENSKNELEEKMGFF